jgi:hypothetical protein
MSNDCHNHETHMGIGLVNRVIDPKWVLYAKRTKPRDSQAE